MARLALLFEAEEHDSYVRLAEELRRLCREGSRTWLLGSESCLAAPSEGAWMTLLVTLTERNPNGDILVVRSALGVLAPIELRGTPPRLAMLLVIDGDPEPAFTLAQLGLEAARRAGTRVRPVMDLSGLTL